MDSIWTYFMTRISGTTPEKHDEPAKRLNGPDPPRNDMCYVSRQATYPRFFPSDDSVASQFRQ